MGRIQYAVGAGTDPGNLRGENQDRVLVKRGSVDGDDFVLMAVADGMGGMEYGDVASRMAVSALDQWWDVTLAEMIGIDVEMAIIKDSLIQSIENANEEIYHHGQGYNATIGTTLSLVFAMRKHYFYIHIGDSRIYELNGSNLIQLTTDHTWVQRAIQREELTFDEAENHHMKHVLLNALGAKSSMKIDQGFGKVKHNSQILICSDGFYNYTKSDSLLHWLQERQNPQEKIDHMVNRIKQMEANDNLSAALLQVKSKLF